MTLLYFEKYLLTIMGWLVFKYIIPLACLIWLLGTGMQSQKLKKGAVRAALTGVMLFAVVPISEHISCIIRDTYEYSIEDAVNEVENVVNNVKENTEEDSEGVISALWNKIKGGVTGVIDTLGNALNGMIESVAVMIVTSCIFPLLTLFGAMKIVKFLIGLDINITLPKQIAIKKKKDEDIVEIEAK